MQVQFAFMYTQFLLSTAVYLQTFKLIIDSFKAACGAKRKPISNK